MWIYIHFLSTVLLSLLLFAVWLQVESRSIVLVTPTGVKFTWPISFSIHLNCSVSAVIHFVKYKHQNSLVSQHKRVWTQ